LGAADHVISVAEAVTFVNEFALGAQIGGQARAIAADVLHHPDPLLARRPRPPYQPRVAVSSEAHPGALLEPTPAGHHMWTVYLQYQRLSRMEPEDEQLPMRWWADLEFFLVALGRLERSAANALSVPAVRSQMEPALKVFRKGLPAIRMLRDVGEHIDA